MRTLGKVLISAMAGTAFMTLYSYSISRKEKQQFREPELLNALARTIVQPSFHLQDRNPALGFFLHYIAGIGFVMGYVPIWKFSRLKPRWTNGMVLGFISGFAGIGIWEATFRLHPDPPKVSKENYYGQLLIAHIIFGAVAGGQWQLMTDKTETAEY